MGRKIFYAVVVLGSIYMLGDIIYQESNSHTTTTFGVATGYPSCGERTCKVAVRWANGREGISTLQSVNTLPVLGEVLKKECHHYKDWDTKCYVNPTGQLSPDAN